MPATYEPIATTTLGSATNKITLSSIPSTYTDLRLVFVAARGEAASGAGLITYNNSGLGTTLYSQSEINGNGSAAASGRSTSQGYLVASRVAGGGFTDTNPALFTMDIFSYSGSTNKTCLMTKQQDNNGSGAVAYNVGLWSSTSAINRIDIQADGGAGTFAIGSTLTLYGIKNA